MNWLRNFMYGRYGADQLSFALLILGMIFSFTASLSGLVVILLLSYAVFAWWLFRALSKNIAARQKENAAFLKIWNPIVGRFRFHRQVFRDRKTHRYFTCPKCRQHVRVPKNKGKIRIICPKCRQEFIKKT